MSLLLALILAALVLVFFEVIVPGGILGLLALLCVLGATWAGAANYGVVGGALTFIGALIAVVLLVIVEFKLMANSRWGNGFTLRTTVSGHSNVAQGQASIVGQRGTTLTRMNPSGKIAIDGRSYQAYSQDGYIDAEKTVVVVKRDNFKLIIRKI